MFKAANNFDNIPNNTSNPISKWEENIAIEGLTLFDIHRQPRKLLDELILNETNEHNVNHVVVSQDVLESLFKDDLKCGICLGTLQTTLTSTACLHRFCSDCLHRSLRMELGAKMHHECPSCRTKLASRRASKPDLKYDKLIQLFTELTQQSTKKRIFSDIEGKTSNEAVNTSSLASIHSNNEEIVLDLGKYRAAHLDKVNEFRERQAKLLNQQQHKLSTRSSSAITLKRQSSSIPSSKSKVSDNINGYDDQHQIADNNNAKTNHLNYIFPENFDNLLSYDSANELMAEKYIANDYLLDKCKIKGDFMFLHFFISKIVDVNQFSSDLKKFSSFAEDVGEFAKFKNMGLCYLYMYINYFILLI